MHGNNAGRTRSRGDWNPSRKVMICYMKGLPNKMALSATFTCLGAYVVEAASLY